MTNKIQKALERIEKLQKTQHELESKLKAEQKKLRYEQRCKHRSALFKVGKLAEAARIDQFDERVLLGAFHKIRERLADPDEFSHCKEIGENLMKDKIASMP